jgi:uncharacterized membrane protein YgdD (TMEM256/DUF423 family)
MTLVSNTVQVSDNVVSSSSEATNISSTGVGGNISESVITVTPIDENLALRSNTVQVGGYALEVPSETTNITPTGVVGGNTSEFPKTPVAVRFVVSNDNGKTLPMSSALLLDANVIFSLSMAVKLILDSEVFPPTTPVGVIFVVSDGTSKS